MSSSSPIYLWAEQRFRATWYISRRPRKCTSSPANLTFASTGSNGNYKIRITSPVLARDVYLSLGAIDAKLSDNYFDILPGETIEITATSNATLDELRAQLKVISLSDAFAPPGLPATVTAAH